MKISIAKQMADGMKLAEYVIANFGIEVARERARNVYNTSDWEAAGFRNKVQSYVG